MDTVTQIIERVQESVCTNYCKYPEEFRGKYSDPDEAFENMLHSVCENCPLNDL